MACLRSMFSILSSASMASSTRSFSMHLFLCYRIPSIWPTGALFLCLRASRRTAWCLPPGMIVRAISWTTRRVILPDLASFKTRSLWRDAPASLAGGPTPRTDDFSKWIEGNYKQKRSIFERSDIFRTWSYIETLCIGTRGTTTNSAIDGSPP